MFLVNLIIPKLCYMAIVARGRDIIYFLVFLCIMGWGGEYYMVAI